MPGIRQFTEPEDIWKNGKTAASVSFVDDAEEKMSELEKQNPHAASRLASLVEDLKSGNQSLTRYRAVSDWLNDPESII